MSSRVFAYNQPRPEDNEDQVILEITRGLFFDGTLNNRRNTEIRKKIKGLDGYGNPSQEEIDIYNKKAKKFKIMSLSRKERGNDSFANDFTNVARMSLCLSEENYAIYLEGAGTEDEDSDTFMGYALGSGSTGIRGKVRKGCKRLAKKIYNEKKGISNIKIIKIYVDAYGFSRGAAAARNFLYEIQKKAYEPGIVNIETDYGQSFSILIDSDGEGIKKSWLKDEKLPPYGHLGIELLKIGFTQEEMEKVKLYPRFIGVYDTVSSYSKHLTLFPDFDDVEELNLNRLGRIKKAVHFTAQDEHRKNFSLTRMPGIEKNLPGVHSDIGGGYKTGKDLVKQIDNGMNLRLLRKLRLKLIEQYWFKSKPSQIEIKLKISKLGGRPFFVLRGERHIKKEYSYIPLHFMGEHAEKYIKDYIIRSIETKYSIDNDNVLRQAKDTLREYVMEDGEEWKFISDEEIARREALENIEETINSNSEGLQPNEAEVDNTMVVIPSANSDLLENALQLEEIIITGYPSQKLLRKLRNEYLHWSAKKEGVGMEPASGRKRTEY